MEVTVENLEDFILKRISAETGIAIEDLNAEDEFVKYGIDSLKTVLIIDELEKWLGIEVNPLYFWSYPTTKSFCQHLLSKYQEASNN